MKVAHLDAALTGSVSELMAKAGSYETEKDYGSAIRVYKAVISKQPLNEKAYTRLMILYRKQKDYSAEAGIIDEAVRQFQDSAPGSGKKASAAKSAAAKIEKLSLSLGKLTGLMDKKGKSLYDPEPIAGWKKRLILVNKRLKTSGRSKAKKK